MSLSDLLAPLLAGARPADLIRVAELLDRESRLLRLRAATIERADLERDRHRAMRQTLAAAVDTVRQAWRNGEDLEAATLAAALEHGCDPDALLRACLMRRPGWTAQERDRRNAEIMRHAAAGRTNAEIAALVGLSTRQVGEIVRRGIARRQARHPYVTIRDHAAL